MKGSPTLELENKEKRKRILQRIRVPLGFAMSILLLILARPTPISIMIGSGIVIIGILIRGWAAGHIHKYERLAVTGPYSFTRNPLYFGSFLLAAGFAIASGVWWIALIVGIAYLAIYFPVMRVEEEDLSKRFGPDFDEFQANVPLFIPRLTPWKKMDAEFDFQLYLKHKEYKAAVAAALAIGILVLKMYFASS